MLTNLISCLYLPCPGLMPVYYSCLNQEKALVGAFSVIVKTDGSFAALVTRLVMEG